jgi:hypothetical protein
LLNLSDAVRIDEVKIQQTWLHRVCQVMSPAPRELWQEILQEDPDALVTQTPEWLDSLCNNGMYEDASRLYLIEDRQRIVIPMARRRYLNGAISRLTSFPNSWGMGGALSSLPLRKEDLEIVLKDLVAQPDEGFSIRPNPLHAECWRQALPESVYSLPRLAHVLELEGGFPFIWEKRFKSSVRRAVRKAERSGLVVERDTTGRLIPVFYELFKKSIERWARKQHEPLTLAHYRARLRDPLSKFEDLASRLGDACQVWVAWLNGEPAASILVLQARNANYTRGAMNLDLAGPTRANDLLHRLAIEEACQAGCRYYHMGETGKATSLASFKENFGAQPLPYEEIYSDRIPFTRLNRAIRDLVKKMIGFKDMD